MLHYLVSNQCNYFLNGLVGGIGAQLGLHIADCPTNKRVNVSLLVKIRYSFHIQYGRALVSCSCRNIVKNTVPASKYFFYVDRVVATNSHRVRHVNDVNARNVVHGRVR